MHSDAELAPKPVSKAENVKRKVLRSSTSLNLEPGRAVPDDPAPPPLRERRRSLERRAAARTTGEATLGRRDERWPNSESSVPVWLP